MKVSEPNENFKSNLNFKNQITVSENGNKISNVKIKSKFQTEI